MRVIDVEELKNSVLLETHLFDNVVRVGTTGSVPHMQYTMFSGDFPLHKVLVQELSEDMVHEGMAAAEYRPVLVMRAVSVIPSSILFYQSRHVSATLGIETLGYLCDVQQDLQAQSNCKRQEEQRN